MGHLDTLDIVDLGPETTHEQLDEFRAMVRGFLAQHPTATEDAAATVVYGEAIHDWDATYLRYTDPEGWARFEAGLEPE